MVSEVLIRRETKALRARKRKGIRLVIGVLGLGIATLTGCTKGMNSAPISMPPANSITGFAYVANSGSGTVGAFAISVSGSLSPIPGSPFAAGSGAEFMALDAVHNFLFVSNTNSNTLSAFSVSATNGALSPILGSPFATGATPQGVAADATGKFVFVANGGDNSISVLAFNMGTNTLTPVPGSPFPGVNNPFGVTVSPSGTFLYVNNLNSNTVSSFLIDSGGALTPVSASPFPTGQTPIPLIADPNGKFVYVGNHMGNSITAYNVNTANGGLSPVGGAPSSAGACAVSCHTNPMRLAIDPADRFIYVTNVGNNSVAAFGLKNGILSPASSPAKTGKHPFGVALDPSGKFLYVVNKVDNSISAFSVNSTAGLLPLPSSPFPAGANGPTNIVTVKVR